MKFLHQVEAHRLVLCACSSVFREIILKSSTPNPSILLFDVELQELYNLLDFMYKGETSVPEPSLTSLIKAAKSTSAGLTSSNQFPPGVSIRSKTSSTNLPINGYRDRGYLPLSYHTTATPSLLVPCTNCPTCQLILPISA